ncbi:translocon-associated protein beta family protein-like [Striga asiatica]|uniref:Translocon-associated protein beta family protein-like n=1 Tax=Striga asiatica TaxID=4170 RepID=A0A5A7RA56_STRAF|nr:translocon-associated protein beta family protein-like [Striga asiatica]
MAFAFYLTTISVLHLILFSSSVCGEGNSPFIVAHKRVSQRKLKSDLERVSVSIDIYNTGSDTAYDVTLTDNSWNQEIFDSIIGNTSKTWDRLDAGSIVSHSFELESKVKTVYYGAPALINYRVPTKSKLQEAYSTPLLPLNILSEPVPQKKIEIKLLSNYGSHISVFLIVVLFAHILSGPKASGAKQKH